ncbi:N-acetyltransferase family protein [Glaesserella sp.]|uniref:GNAT family N-acetyltransferase n=1 Tax=Glaesserella sp. TaxID=2094731 RepID=UPI0035A1641A
MSDFYLQPAVQDDLAEIVAIYNSTVASRRITADLAPVTVESRQAWFDAHKENRPIYVLKNSQNEVIAWGSFSDYYSRDAYRISAEISVYIKNGYRGMGIGNVLVSYMLEKAPSLGIQNVIALIFAHNEPSIKLFGKLGFRHWGTLPEVCDLGGYLADVVILGKKLSEA